MSKSNLRYLLVLFPRNRKNEKKTIYFHFLFVMFNFQFSHLFEIKFEEVNIQKAEKMSKMAIENQDDLFEIETDTFNINKGEQLPISLFQETEAELCDRLMHGYESSPEDHQTDGPLEFIQNIVDNVRTESEDFIEDEDKKNSWEF